MRLITSVQPTSIVLTLRIAARDEQMHQALAALLGPIAAQPGCQRCELMVDADQSETVTFLEEWATRADLDRHFRSEECRHLLALLEMADAPPELHVDSVASREGMEAIASARGQRMDVRAAPADRSDDND